MSTADLAALPGGPAPVVGVDPWAAPWATVPWIPWLVATAGGVGLLRPAPGTWASAVTAVLLAALWLASGSWWLLALGVALVTLAGTWAAGVAARRTGDPDPSRVVVDEVAGMGVGALLLPTAVCHGTPWTAAGVLFLLFRCFDIAKPWPISRLERLPGGIGIMADDLAAGAAAGVFTVAFLA